MGHRLLNNIFWGYSSLAMKTLPISTWSTATMHGNRRCEFIRCVVPDVLPNFLAFFNPSLIKLIAVILYLGNALVTCSVQFRHGSRKVLDCRRCYSQHLQHNGIAACGTSLKVLLVTFSVFGRYAGICIILPSGSYCGCRSASISNLSATVFVLAETQVRSPRE